MKMIIIFLLCLIGFSAQPDKRIGLPSKYGTKIFKQHF